VARVSSYYHSLFAGFYDVVLQPLALDFSLRNRRSQLFDALAGSLSALWDWAILPSQARYDNGLKLIKHILQLGTVFRERQAKH